MQVRPYPFEHWPKLTRGHLDALRFARRNVASGPYAAGLALLGELFGAKVTLEHGAPELCSQTEAHQRLHEPLVGILLEREHAGVRTNLIIASLPQHAAAWVDRTLGGDGATSIDHSAQRFDELSCGVLAYVVARFLAALEAGFQLRQITTHASDLHAQLGAEVLLVQPLALCVGQTRAELTLLVPHSALAGATLPLQPSAAGSWLDALPITLAIEAGRATLAAQLVHELTPGDVIVPDVCGLRLTSQGPLGALIVAPIGSRHWLQSKTDDGVQLRIVQRHTSGESAMSTGKHVAGARDATSITASQAHDSPLASDAPIELSLELARFSLSLGELANLGPGEVLTTGRPLGTSVTLRAAGKALAEGELVDVDGEVGVRLLRLLP